VKSEAVGVRSGRELRIESRAVERSAERRAPSGSCLPYEEAAHIEHHASVRRSKSLYLGESSLTSEKSAHVQWRVRALCEPWGTCMLRMPTSWLCSTEWHVVLLSARAPYMYGGLVSVVEWRGGMPSKDPGRSTL
jgi:hypothetical protein